MSVSSNEVTLSGPTIVNVSYIANSFVVTEGEDASPPPSIIQSGEVWKIAIGANRSDSEAVANSYNALTGGGRHEYAPSKGNPEGPDELNFFFGINLTIQTNAGQFTTPVYLGQGNVGLTNNWWIGGNWIVHDEQPLLLIISNNQIVSISALSGNTSEFKITEV